MITPYQKPEDKDAKASSFWSNLAGKMGLSTPLIRAASAPVEKAPLLSDGIQVHGERAARPASASTREMGIVKTAASLKVSDSLMTRYAGVFHRAVAELGQAERVKAADRLSRIEADMSAFRDKLMGLGGEPAMVDLCGEVSAKADGISGVCVQLRDKVEALSLPQAQSIENAFLVLNDAKTSIEKMGPAGMGAAMPLEMGMEMGLPGAGAEDVGGDIPEMPLLSAEEPHAPEGPVAGHVNAFVKKAMDASYDELRMIHTKLCLVESMLSALSSELNVSEMLGPVMETPGMAPEGMPPTDQVPGEQKDLEPEAELKELGARCKGRMSAFAASGDPGDSEPGNTIYKDLGKCRDCVWFESDWTHETYRDKCKHCAHASLGGAVEHFWPRSQQMIVWAPQWAAPQAAPKKAFRGTLGLSQTAKTVNAAALEIAAEIVASVGHTAVELGTEFMSYFQDPVVARAMPLIAAEITSEIENLTGIEIAITAGKARAWGRKADAKGRKYQMCDKVVGEFPDEKNCGRPAKSPGSRCELHPITRIWPGNDEPAASGLPSTCPGCDSDKPFEPGCHGFGCKEEGKYVGKTAGAMVRVPKDFEVQPLKPGENPPGKATCGTCGLSWDDDKPTSWTPAPSARCPFEYYHVSEPEEPQVPERGIGRQRQESDPALGIGGTASVLGEVIIACDTSLVHLAKGEKRKIKELREQLQGEKDSAKIKSLNDAIDSLYSRIDSDKERREKRRTEREEKRKKAQESADKEPAKLPAAVASFRGSLCLAKKSDHEDGGKHDQSAQSSSEDSEPAAAGKVKKAPKQFRVITVSKNTNSFGLHDVIMMAQDGEAYEAAHGQMELPAKGQTVSIPYDEQDGGLSFAAAGYEIPHKLPAPPSEVISEVWGKQASSGRSL